MLLSSPPSHKLESQIVKTLASAIQAVKRGPLWRHLIQFSYHILMNTDITFSSKFSSLFGILAHYSIFVCGILILEFNVTTNLQNVNSNFGKHIYVKTPIWVSGHLKHQLGPWQKDCYCSQKSMPNVGRFKNCYYQSQNITAPLQPRFQVQEVIFRKTVGW